MDSMPTTFSRAFALAAAVLLPAGPLLLAGPFLLAGPLLLARPLLAAGRVDVPIRQIVLPDGNPRYSVPVTVGDGPPVEAALDTGSFGLRILKAATAPGQYQATDLHRSYAFGGGAEFKGVLARGVVGVGDARTAGPVLFHLVETVGCVDGRPACAASKVKPADYRIAGDGYPGQGYSAILGLSLRRAAAQDSAQNPLTAAGPRSWIVVLPRPGEAAPGHLIIDPDEADRAGFTAVKLPPAAEASGGRLAGFADTALPGCLVEEGDGQRFCGPSLLDTGAPGLSVATDTVTGPKPWGAGRHARIEIGGPDGPASLPFTSGADYASRVVLHPRRGPAGGADLSFGSLPYLTYAVLYDADAGTVGFRRRDPAAP